MERQRYASQRVMKPSKVAATAMHGSPSDLWAALRIEGRASVERTTLGFGQCGWRQDDEKAQR